MMNKLFFTTAILFCGISSVISNAQDLTRNSPTQIINLYYKSQGAGDVTTLRKIMVLDVDTPDDKIIKRDIQALVNQKGIDFIVGYEKITNDKKAEVGVILAKMPTTQVRLVKDNDIWKIKDFYQLSADELITELKSSPNDANLWFYAGRRALVAGNPTKYALCCQKYLELAGDKNFWLTPAHIVKMKTELDFERNIKSDLPSYNGAKNNGGKCQMGRLLAISYIENGEFDKAQEIINEMSLPKYQKWNQWKDVLSAELKERKAGKSALDTVDLWIKESAKRDVKK